MELLAPGMHVAGKYVLQRPLARGAMGEVWIGTHASLGGEVAIKFLALSSADDGEDEATAMARFRFEAQVAAKLSRKTRHIVGVTDHGEEFGRAYLVMDLVDGESLEALMRREGRCSLRTIAPIVAQVAKGLMAAHGEGVFHRDLKPANILLTRDEDSSVLVKILDFGIAKTVRSHKISGVRNEGAPPSGPGHETEVGIVLGTPNYMSPEQARGLATLDHRCDLWALSTIAYEALCGTLPYDGETTADLLVNICSVEPVPVRTHRSDLPESAEKFFKKAFAGNVNKRFQDAASLASAFAEIAADGAKSVELPLPAVDMPPAVPSTTDRDVKQVAPVEARAVTTGIDLQAYEPPRRRLGVFVALGAVLLIGAVFAAVALTRTDRVAPARSPEPVATPKADLPAATPTPTHSNEPTPAATPEPTPHKSPVAGKPPAAKPTATPSPTPQPVAPSPTTTATTKKPLDKGEIL